MSSPIAGVTAVNAIIFGVYAQVQKWSLNQNNLSTHFLAGAIAGLAQSPISSPLELVKTRLQLQDNHSGKDGKKMLGAVDCLRDIYRRAGLKGIFKGFGITTLREAPGFGLYFCTYEALTRTNSNQPISTIHMLIAGGLAGTTSWIFTYPIDVIKSRLQADVNSKYIGAMDCLKKSLIEEGTVCLFKGLNSTIIRAFPTNAATFAVVHWTFRFFGMEEISGYQAEVDKNQQISRIYQQTNPDSFKIRFNSLLNSLWNEDAYAKSFFFAVASVRRDSPSVNSDDSLPGAGGSIVEPDSAT